MRKKVLVVDDSANWRSLFARIIEDCGYEAQAVPDLRTAIKVITREFFHAAIIDLRLDEWDENNVAGLDIASYLTQLGEGTRVVIATGYGTVEATRTAFRQSKVFDFLQKQGPSKDEIVQILASLPSDLDAPNRFIDPLDLLMGMSPRDVDNALAGGTRHRDSREATAQGSDEASTKEKSRQASLTNLRQILAHRFIESELRDLYFDLGIGYDDLPGDSKLDKARELIDHLAHRDRIADLLRIGRQMRPDIPWSSMLEVTTKTQRLLASLLKPYQPLIGHLQPPSVEAVRYRHGEKIKSSNVVDIRFWSKVVGRPIIARLASADLPESYRPQFIGTLNADSSLRIEDIIGRVYTATEQEIPFSQFDPWLGRSRD